MYSQWQNSWHVVQYEAAVSYGAGGREGEGSLHDIGRAAYNPLHQARAARFAHGSQRYAILSMSSMLQRFSGFQKTVDTLLNTAVRRIHEVNSSG